MDAVAALLAVPAPDDDQARLEIADLIQEASRKGRPLPSLSTVRACYRNNQPFQPSPTLREWIETWLDGRKDLAASTRHNYETLARLQLIPYLGGMRLDQIRPDHLRNLFTQIEEFNTFIRLVRTTGTPQQRAEIKWRKPAGPATQQRILSLLRGLFTDAIAEERIRFNPVLCIKSEAVERPKPLIWTPARVRRWRTTGDVPSRLMVWTPELTRAFLDHAAADPLYPLFHLLVFLGLRRGEACGLTWPDLDPVERTLTINRQITLIAGQPVTTPPKTQAGRRQLPLDQPTLHLLTRHRHLPDDTDLGPMFTDPAGNPLNPESVTNRFKALINEAGLPPIRLHDLRHGAPPP